MDAGYVHQRDVTNILGYLHQKIEEANSEQEKNPIPEIEFKEKINTLISETDRDLRLKTQAIMRTRLSKSNRIPVNYAPLVKLDGHQFQVKYEPLSAQERQAKEMRELAMSQLPLANNRMQTTQQKIMMNSKLPPSLFQGFSKTTNRLKENVETRSKSSFSPLSSKIDVTDAFDIDEQPPSKLIKDSSKKQHNVSPKSPKMKRAKTTKRPIRSAKGYLTPRKETSAYTLRSRIKERPQTAYSTVRKRQIPDYTPQLPQPDKYDPKAEPPPINDKIVNKYGLQQLSESRLVKQKVINEKLKDTIHISPFKKDIAADYRNFNQNYYLDPITLDDVEKEKPKLEDLPLPTERSETPTTPTQLQNTFALINGVPDQTSPEFQKFKRKNATIWESIEIILHMLAPLCEQYGLNNVRVYPNRILDFTKYDPDEIPMQRLLRCFVKIPGIKKYSTKIGFGFIGENAEEKAAVAIQSIWRGYIARRDFKHIKRQIAAAKLIKDRWRIYVLSSTFNKTLEKERHKKNIRFDGIQSDPTIYRPNELNILVHLIDSFTAIDFGRLTSLENKSSIVVFYMRKAPTNEIMELIKEYKNDISKLHIQSTSLRFSTSISIEDVFASDFTAMKQIRSFSSLAPIFLIPAHVNSGLVEASLKLGSLPFSPSPVRAQMYDSREAVRRILKASGVDLFEASSEIFDFETLCKELAGLAVSNLGIQSWILHSNDGSIGWLTTSDFSLLEKLRMHRNVVTDDDLVDETFRNMLKQSIGKELKNVITTTRDTDPEQFLRSFTSLGGIIEAAPQHGKSSPAVAIFVPPFGEPKIVGSWEMLYISAYEPFASIHPAFTVKGDKLKKRSYKIAVECRSKRLLGYSVVQYYYSPRSFFNDNNEETVKMKLTPSNLTIGKVDEVLPHLLLETVLHVKFNEESMKIIPNKYAYVQKSLILPEEIEFSRLKMRCESFSLPIGTRVFFIPSFQSLSEYSLIVCEDDPAMLIHLVYQTFYILSVNVFDSEKRHHAKLYEYLNAIEYLKQQFENTNGITTTLMSQKISGGRKKKKQKRKFQFNLFSED